MFLFGPNVQKMAAQKQTHKLINVLREGHRPRYRAAAARALGTLGEPLVVGPLVAALKDSETLVQDAVLEALERLRIRDAADGIIEFLKTERQKKSVFAAAHCLCTICGASDFVEILPRFEWCYEGFRDACNEVLVECADAAAIDRLISMLMKPVVCESLRGQAASVLGARRVERAIPALESALDEDTDFGISCNALKALGMIGGKRALNAIYGHLRKGKNILIVCEVLEQAGDSNAVTELCKALSSTSEHYKIIPIAETLGRIGNSSAIRPLRETLPRWDRHLAEWTGRIYGGLGGIPRDLSDVLMDYNRAVRTAISEALAKLEKKG